MRPAARADGASALRRHDQHAEPGRQAQFVQLVRHVVAARQSRKSGDRSRVWANFSPAVVFKPDAEAAPDALTRSAAR